MNRGMTVQTEMAVAGGSTEPAQQKKDNWPGELPKQIAAIRDLASANGVEKVGSRKKEVESILESLAALGLLIAFDTPEGKRWRAAAYSNA